MDAEEKKLYTHHEILRSGGIDNYSNYAGDVVPDSHVFVYSRHRDSEGVQIVNYDTILETLKEFPDNSIEIEGENYYPDVYIHSNNHWAVGWVDMLFVRKGTPQCEKAIELLNSLEDYPLLDDDKYYSHTCTDCDSYFESESDLSGGLCESCIETRQEKFIKELFTDIQGEKASFILYNSQNNVFESYDDFDYFIDEIKEAISAGHFFNVVTAEKSGFCNYYTIAKTEAEALNDIDIFLSSNYFTAEVYKIEYQYC